MIEHNNYRNNFKLNSLFCQNYSCTKVISNKEIGTFVTYCKRSKKQDEDRKVDYNESMTRQQDPLTMDFVLLGLIGQKPTHAYDLYRKLTGSEELKTLWTFRQSRLYAVLDKIEKNGLISTSIDPESALPVRKICTLTPEGEAVFEQWLHSPVAHLNEIRSDFLGKMYFLKDRPEKERLAVIEAQIFTCRKWQDSIEKKLRQHPDSDDFLHIVYSFRADFIRSALHWLESL